MGLVLWTYIPKTLKQALSSDKVEFWSEAVLDEVSNLEDVFSAFGPPVPRTSEMSVTPSTSRFLFSKKIVSSNGTATAGW